VNEEELEEAVYKPPRENLHVKKHSLRQVNIKVIA